MALMYSSATEQKVIGAAALAQFATPAPMGRFHKPTPFVDFAELVEHRLGRQFQIETSEYAVSHDGNKMFGMIELAPLEGELITADEWRMQVGVRSSHDQSLQTGLTMGTRVIVCSNLCFTGDIGRWDTKNTLNKMERLPLLVEDAVRLLPQFVQRENTRRDAYKLRELKPRHGDAALVEVYRRGGMTAAQLGRAVDEWNEPSHAEHGQDGFNVWRCWNAVTEALKPTGQQNNMELVRQRSMTATKFFDEVVGI